MSALGDLLTIFHTQTYKNMVIQSDFMNVSPDPVVRG